MNLSEVPKAESNMLDILLHFLAPPTRSKSWEKNDLTPHLFDNLALEAPKAQDQQILLLKNKGLSSLHMHIFKTDYSQRKEANELWTPES